MNRADNILLPPRAEQCLRELRKYLEERFGARLQTMCLFGSYARGEADPHESDVDVLVVVEGIDLREHRGIVSQAAEITVRHNLQTSPLVMSTADGRRCATTSSSFSRDRSRWNRRMTEGARAKVVAVELARGAEALTEAELLASRDLFRGALSRLYFAALHWAQALLASRGTEAKSHRGVKSLIGQDWVATGSLEAKYQRILAQLETWRDESDYDRHFEADAEMVREQLVLARELRDRIMAILGQAGLA